MKTFTVTEPFLLSDSRGTRTFDVGDPVTDVELGAYLPDVEHCLTETAAEGPLEPAPEPEL